MPRIIEACHLTRKFDGVAAVSDLCLEVEAGELFGLVGPDGAGKTTTIRLLCGVLKPSDGEARVAGYSIRGQEEQIKSRIGYMPQRFGLYGDLTVMENLHFYGEIYGVPRKEKAQRFARLLEFSQLRPFSDRLVRDLSGGMKQKLGLACALLHTPQVLFLDEPTGGVDPVSRRDLWRILHELTKQGVTVFMSTAYLDEAERCARVGLIHRGRLLVCASPESVISSLPGEVWKIQCDNNCLARERIRAIDGVTGILVGSTLRLIFSHPENTIDGLRDHLKQEGIRVLGTKKVSPSLEDAFTHCIQQNMGQESS